MHMIAQANPFQQIGDVAGDLFFLAVRNAQRQGNVIKDGKRIEKRGVLKNHSAHFSYRKIFFF